MKFQFFSFVRRDCHGPCFAMSSQSTLTIIFARKSLREFTIKLYCGYQHTANRYTELLSQIHLIGCKHDAVRHERSKGSADGSVEMDEDQTADKIHHCCQ